MQSSRRRRAAALLRPTAPDHQVDAGMNSDRGDLPDDGCGSDKTRSRENVWRDPSMSTLLFIDGPKFYSLCPPGTTQSTFKSQTVHQSCLRPREKKTHNPVQCICVKPRLKRETDPSDPLTQTFPPADGLTTAWRPLRCFLGWRRVRHTCQR